jgi:hypothetical protein
MIMIAIGADTLFKRWVDNRQIRLGATQGETAGR